MRHIIEFTTTYPAAQTHILDRNYRSAPEIVLAAKQLIRRNRARIDKDYQPVADVAGEIVIRGYASPEIEVRQVALAIAELVGQGNAVDSIAILYRTGTIGLAFQGALKELGIPFEVRGSADLWQSVAARLVVGSLTYLRDGDSPEAISLRHHRDRQRQLALQAPRLSKPSRRPNALRCIGSAFLGSPDRR